MLTLGLAPDPDMLGKWIFQVRAYSLTQGQFSKAASPLESRASCTTLSPRDPYPTAGERERRGPLSTPQHLPPPPRSLPSLLRGLNQGGPDEKTHPTSSLVGGEQLSPSAERLHRPDFRQGGQLSPNPRFWDERVHTWHGVAWPRQQSPAPGKSRP